MGSNKGTPNYSVTKWRQIQASTDMTHRLPNSFVQTDVSGDRRAQRQP